MTIKELKEKITGFTEALAINEVSPFDKVFAESMKDSLIELQAKLIKALEVTMDCGNSVDHVHLSGAWDKPETNKQDLPWDWDSRDSMTDEEYEKAINNIA